MIERRWIVNGNEAAVAFPPERRLLDVLRGELGLTGAKEGCGEGECGSCSVLVDGRLVLACLTLAATLPDTTRILTVEGIEQTPLGRALQASFLEAGAVQCGFCTPGMLLAAYALLARVPHPSEEDARIALSGNLCRCTGYRMILEAVLACGNGGAVGAMGGGGAA